MDIFITVIICLIVFFIVILILYFAIRTTDREQRSTSIREAHDYLQARNTDSSKLSNIPIVIHTIPRLTERQARMQEQMEKIGYTKYAFYYGLDKNEMNLDTWRLSDGIRRTIKVPPKERQVLVAHTLSMLGLLQEVYSFSDEPYILLLEDDVSLCMLPGWDRSIQEIIDEAPSDWGILSLIPHGSYATVSANRWTSPSSERNSGSYAAISANRYMKYNGFSCAAWIFKREAIKTILDKVITVDEIDLNKLGHDIVADMSFPRIVNTYVTDKFYFIDYNLDEESTNMIDPDNTWKKLSNWEGDLFQVYNNVYIQEQSMDVSTESRT